MTLIIREVDITTGSMYFQTSDVSICVDIMPGH